MLELNNVLFIDTESNPVTKEPECLTWLMGESHGIIEGFGESSYEFMKNIWNRADAVVMFNAPYDMGVLSIMFAKNKYSWKIVRHGPIKTDKTASWDMNIFGNKYSVRRISYSRNMINPMTRTVKVVDLNYQRPHPVREPSTPVVDLLKLWSILVDDKDSNQSISLKALIKRELGIEAIPYTPENACTDAYRLQDVFRLRELVGKFFIHVEDLELDYTWEMWAYIKTPATFTKLAYRDRYPHIRQWKKGNDIKVEGANLGAGLENAFHGGITLSFFEASWTIPHG